MSKFRPECSRSYGEAMPDDTALFLIRDAVAHRRSLIFGRLNNNQGGHCALGCFWNDNPNVTLNTTLVDEVAAVNDSLPRNATPYARWRKVNAWLRWKVQHINDI